MPSCPACGREHSEDARFCSSCGTAIAVERPTKVRKLVTVLFADVVGSTAMGERLDPEALRALMSRYYARARRILERHGGTVEKFIGDAVMATFGIPRLHEDDALRGVRAAAELREAFRAEGRGDPRLAIRMGVNTGEVVTEESGLGQTLVTGDAVNTAARLEQAAAPGEILIGEPTYRLVRDAVSTQPADPLEVKGKADPLRAHRLLEVHPHHSGHARHLDSPMVGRERERTELLDVFRRVVEGGGCRLVTVIGPAGVGKSRLVEEVVAGIAGGATVLRGRCLPYGEGITYWPVAEAIRQLVGSSQAAPGGTRDSLARLLDPDEHGEAITGGLARVLGLDAGSGAPEDTFWAVRKLLESQAHIGPVILVLDDIHWAEPTLLDLIRYLVEWSRGAPIMLLCMARPDLLDERPGWGTETPYETRTALEPLSTDESERLIENLLGQASLAEHVRERIIAAAEGNPLFVEEMLRMLIDDGLLRRENGRWAPAGDLSEIPVPPTIQALLASRLDRLDQGERRVIERAAVAGKVFSWAGVVELTPATLRPRVGAHLMSLVRRELIRPEPSDLAADDTFAFRHILIRDAAYRGLSKEMRAELHESFADWLEKRRRDELAGFEEIIGYHLEQASRYRAELRPGDERAAELGLRAGMLLAAAGHRAFARGDTAAAANLLERSMNLRPTTDPDVSSARASADPTGPPSRSSS